MIQKIFNDILKQGSYYTNSEDGDAFEQRFKNKLKASGYSEIIQEPNTKSSIEQIVSLENSNLKTIKKRHKELKERILLKNSLELIENPYKNIKNTFIFQPFGSQNFPDFLLFTNDYAIPIEIKFSKNDKDQKNLNSFRPMWNSNMPKPNAIYIYGVSGEQVTFFLGSDILDHETRKALLNFFECLDSGKEKLDEQLKSLKNDFGIYPYIRKAYEHKKSHSTYIDIDNKQMIQSYFSNRKIQREKNVINFLSELKK